MKNIISIIALIVSFNVLGQYVDKINKNAPEQMKELAFTLGKWEFQWTTMNSDRSYKDGGKSSSNVYLIQDGYVYCDDFFQDLNGQLIIGSTLRSFDANTGKWKMLWAPAGNLTPSEFEGGVQGDSLVFWQVKETTDSFGSFKTKITFYDIKKNSYSWKSDRLYDGKILVEKVAFYTATRIE